jgi:ankyrin repeat protein
MFATTSKNIETMKLLLDAGADVTIKHTSGQTALNMARDLQFAGGVTLLEQRAAAPPVAAVSSVANPEENKKLSDAVRTANKRAVVTALAAGANVNSSVGFFQVTPLHWAMHANTNDQPKMVPIIKLLLEKGADVNLKTHDGVTPFMQSLHSPTFFYLLLQKHPDLTIETNAGKTVMDIAKGPPRREQVIDVLNVAGGGDWDGAIRIASVNAEMSNLPPPAPETEPEPEPASPLAAVAQAVESAVASAVAPPAQDNALEAAITSNDDTAAQSAILSGANPNMMLHGDRETVFIHYAATENHPMVEFLLAHGADVNARAGPRADEPGWTALDYTTDDDMLAILRAAGGRTRRELDASPSPAPAPASAPEGVSRPVLSGRSDLKIPPIWVRDHYRSAMTEGVDWEVINIPEIFVAKLGRDLTLDQFFRKYMGDGIVFKVGAKFYGVERKDLMQEYSEGSAIAYECTKTFAMDDPDTRGSFEYSDIYATPYFALRTPAGVLYTDLLGAVDILSRPHAFYKVGTDPVKKLENVASRSSVLAGGPVASQLHCQAGSGENVYEISPFRLPEIEEEEKEKEEKEEPNVVYVKKGEDKTEFPLDLSQTVLQLKEAVKEKLGIAVESQKFIFQGKVMKNEETLGDAKVGKGYTIQLQTIGGRRFTRKYCKKTACKTMGFTQKASCRPYKNCYRHKKTTKSRK